MNTPAPAFTSSIVLLRVDTQNAFTPEGGLPVAAGREIVPGVVYITSKAHELGLLVIDTVDIHPKGHISFASRHGLAPFSPNPLDPSDMVWPDHSVGETGDVELIKGIPRNAEEAYSAAHPHESSPITGHPTSRSHVQIYKWYSRNRDAYSGFDMGVTALNGNAVDGYEIAAGAKTLDQVLEEVRAKVLIVVGLVTEVCVKNNVLDALKRGYSVKLYLPGIRGLTPAGHESTVRELLALNGKPNAQGRIQDISLFNLAQNSSPLDSIL